jgi:hypothetical protein
MEVLLATLPRFVVDVLDAERVTNNGEVASER